MFTDIPNMTVPNTESSCRAARIRPENLMDLCRHHHQDAQQAEVAVRSVRSQSLPLMLDCEDSK